MDMKNAEVLRSYSKRETLTNEAILEILTGKSDKPCKPKYPPVLKIKHNTYSKFFGTDANPKEMEAIIEQALTEYFANHHKQEGEESA
jgi:hypothetical protein